MNDTTQAETRPIRMPTVVQTARGPVSLVPATRTRITRFVSGQPVTDEEPVWIAVWRGRRASGETPDAAVQRVTGVP